VQHTTPNQGLFFVIVGPGGVGKDTLIKTLFDALSPNEIALYPLITATSRPPRTGEEEGVSYYFKTRQTFETMIANNELIEYQEVTKGNYYGVPRAPVDEAIHKGECIIGDVDVLGARAIRKQYPHNSIIVFIRATHASIEDELDILQKRMEGRGDSPDKVEERLQRARDVEFPYLIEADAVIVNDDLTRAQQALYNLIRSHIKAQEA